MGTAVCEVVLSLIHQMTSHFWNCIFVYNYLCIVYALNKCPLLWLFFLVFFYTFGDYPYLLNLKWVAFRLTQMILHYVELDSLVLLNDVFFPLLVYLCIWIFSFHASCWMLERGDCRAGCLKIRWCGSMVLWILLWPHSI